jgi:hypothetical protein
MIAAGADVRVIETDMYSPPLHLAIEQEWLPIVASLIRAGADVNAPHPDMRTGSGGKCTPLIHAIDIACDAASQAGRTPDEVDTGLIELLLQSGAVPTPGAFEMAKSYRNDKVAALLHRFSLVD